jgi:hypothetical protein
MNPNKINNEDFEAPLKRITSPMTPWQVYELGLTINHAAAKIYRLLAENCTDQEIGKEILRNNKREAEILEDRISLHRTNEMVDYYGSRGRIKHGIEGEMDRQMYESFDDDGKAFLAHFDHLLETIKQMKAPFDPEEVWNLYKRITAEIGNFYLSIIDLYPPGETSDAVIELYDLIFSLDDTKLQ